MLCVSMDGKTTWQWREYEVMMISYCNGGWSPNGWNFEMRGRLIEEGVNPEVADILAWIRTEEKVKALFRN